MEITELLDALAAGLISIDTSKKPYKNYSAGVGPYSETVLVKALASFLSSTYPDQFAKAKTQRTPDLLVPEKWAIEAKLVRPYGDNGNLAEHWSQNLLHPYEGNTSLIGDVQVSQMAGRRKTTRSRFHFLTQPTTG